MKKIDWPSSGRKAKDADPALLDRGMERLAALDADGIRRRRLSQRKEAWISNVSFVALWILAARLTALLSGNSAIEALVGFWIAVNGTIFINAVVVARREGWI